MRCGEVEKLLPDYLSGNISASQRQLVEEHLSHCARCRKALADYNEAKQYLTSLKDSPVPPEFTKATMIKVKASDNSKSVFQKWLRPALGAMAVVIVLAVLLVIQPWGLSPQSVMARAYAATEGLQSYRMSSYMTSIFNGETEEQTCEMAFAAPDRYHVRATIDGERHELIIISGRLYRYQPDEPDSPQSSQVTVAVSPGSLLSKEYTLQILDNLANLETLPDGEIEGVECLHYRGRVDMERMVEEQMASLDPEQPGYEEMVKAMGQTREQAHQMKIEVELWIGKDDYLIRQMRTDMGIPSGEPEGWQHSTALVKYYDLNQPITIEPPLMPSGELLPGWELADSRPAETHFDTEINYEIIGKDPVHQQISLSVTITNVGIEAASNVRVGLHNIATIRDGEEESWISAEPSIPGPVNLEPGESETYSVSWEYDASHIAKEKFTELINKTIIRIIFTTPDGYEAIRLYSEDAPYPSAIPPEKPPG